MNGICSACFRWKHPRCGVTPSVLPLCGNPPSRRGRPSGAATAACRYDPSGEKVFQKRPQAFLEHNYKNPIPLIMRRAEAERIPNRPPPLAPEHPGAI